MIEIGGVRYALGRPTARMARTAMTLWTAFAAASMAHVIMTVTRSVPDMVVAVTDAAQSLAFLAALMVAGMTAMTAQGADHQPITVTNAASPRLVRWWSSTWRQWRMIPMLFIAVLVATMVSLGGTAVITLSEVLTGELTRRTVLPVTICAVGAVMVWALWRGWQLVNTMAHTAALGSGAPYFGFDWTRVDSSAEAQFRARFRQPQWPFPGKITALAEADKYANRARERRLAMQMGAAASALLAIALAQHTLTEVVTASWQALTHLGQSSPSYRPPSICDQVSIIAAFMVWVLPLGLQSLATEKEALAKLYDDRRATLREQIDIARRTHGTRWRAGRIAASHGKNHSMRRRAGGRTTPRTAHLTVAVEMTE